jgi:DNA polymerase-3 subunit delta'
MGFDSLLGNRQLKENLTAAINRGRISHFYLISGPAGSGKKTLSRLLAAAIHCKSANKPCMTCSACRKVMADTHPDLITVTDPEHKNIAVKIVRDIREDMFVRPNESDRKIYVFAQSLADEGQNALLKVLEEPPQYGVFILLSENPESLLTTVRSRCTELKLLPLPQDLLENTLSREFPDAEAEAVTAAAERSGGYLGQARKILEENLSLPPQVQQLAEAFSTRNGLLLTQTLIPMEDWKADRLRSVLQQVQEVLQQALLARSGLRAASKAAQEVAKLRNGRELNEAIACLKKADLYLQGNVSPAAVCGWLAWALR